jgi:hypothetical protein
MNPVTLVFLFVVVGLMGFGIWKGNRDREGISPDLLRAAKGDKKLAKRLLLNAQMRHPGKSERWYQEKVLYDLERDGAGRGQRSKRSWGRMTNREKIENLVIVSFAFSLFNTVFSSIMRMFGRDR